MLKIKYIPDFKNHEPYLLIASTAEGFLNAARFFRQKDPTVINDPSITAVSEVSGIRSPLSLTPDECMELADIFERVGGSGKPSHDYFDIKSLPNTEIIVSYGETAKRKTAGKGHQPSNFS